MHTLLKRILLPLAPLFFLCGCIVVDDFGDYWDKGTVEPCVNEIMQEKLIDEKKPNDVPPMRTLHLGKYTFLMVRDHAEEKGGDLIRYDIKDGYFITYRLNENKREDFLHYYPGSGVIVTTETATIPVLTEQSAVLLETIAGDATYWVENERQPYHCSKP